MSSFPYFNYVASLLLFLFGLYTVITSRNLFRKVFGIVFLQTGVILFFISVAYKTHAGIPIIHRGSGHEAIDVVNYMNPLPHALMLTAIVVGVATLGVALTLIVALYKSFGTLEEDEILDKMEKPS